MGFDIARLSQPILVFDSETIGKLDVYFCSTNALIEAKQKTDPELQEPVEVIRRLIGEICMTHISDHAEGELKSRKLTNEELGKLTEAELNKFSAQYLENDKSLNEYKDLVKTETQSDAEFFLQVLDARLEKLSAPLSRTAESLNNGIASLLKSDFSAIRELGETLRKQGQSIPSFDYPSIKSREVALETFQAPPNPIAKTNERLGDVTDRLETLVQFGSNALNIMHKLQVAAAEFIDRFSSEAEKNSQAAKRAILVGCIVSVLRTAL